MNHPCPVDDMASRAALLDSLPGLVYRCRWNAWPAFCFAGAGSLALTGHAAAELVAPVQGQEVCLIHPDDLERVRAELARAVADGGTWRVRYRLRHRDGHDVPVLDRGRVEAPGADGAVYLCGLLEDATGQESDRQALGQARDLLASVVDEVPAIVFLKDAEDLRWSMGNRALAETMRRPLESLIGITDFDVFPIEQAQAFRADDLRALASPEPIVIEEELASLDPDHPQYVRTSKTALRDSTGKATHLLGVSVDITEQHAAIVALKQAETHMRAVLDSLFAFVGVVSPDGDVLQVNRPALEMAGVAQEAVLGRPIWDTPWFAHSRRIRSRLADACRQAAQGGRTRFDTSARMGTRAFDIDLMVAPLIDDDGAVTHIVLSAVDISDRIATEAELQRMNLELERRVEMRTSSLRESEVRFRSAMQQSAIGMALVSPEGRWLDVNQAVCKITGYSRDELLKKTFQDITYPEDLESDLANVTALLEGRIEGFEMEKRYVHKAGHIVWVMLSVSLVRYPDGSPNYFISQIQDIHARHQVDSAMHAVSTDLIALEGQAFYDKAVGKLREILDSDLAFIAVHSAREPGIARTVALVNGDNIVPNIDIELANGPCERVLKGASLVVRNGLLGTYALSGIVQALGMDAYAGEPILDRSGNVLGHLAVLRKTALPEEAEVTAALKIFALAVGAAMMRERDRRQYEALFEFAPDALVMVDSHGVIRLVNQQAEQMFGWSRDELCGRAVECLMPEQLRGSHVGLRDRFLTSAMPRAMGAGRSDLRGMRKDGTVFPVDISLSPMDTENGRMIAAAVRDVSHRIKAEAAMHQALATLDVTVDGAFMFDPDSLQFIYVNEGATRQLGYSREELLEMTPVSIKPQFEEAEFRAMIAPLIAGEQSVIRFETLHRHKNGSDIAVEISLQYVAAHGERGRFIAIVRDMTERLEQEADRAARAAAEQANAAKSTFLATMSHEIRTPMNGVIGSIDLLARSSLKPHQVELAETIRESSFSLLSVIDDVLDFSKIEAGKLEMEEEPVSIERVVDSVTTSLRPLALRKGVMLETFCDPGLPHWIVSDGVRLRQILNNLVSNAIKFSSGPQRRGWVGVRAEPDGNSALRLVVSDNGIGMSEDVQARLFQPFVQAEASTTRRYGGTGLGLTICQRLVELFKGDIAVASTAGKGATFTVTIPYVVDENASPPPLPPDVAGLHCVVAAASPETSDNWCTYLGAAGAQAEAVPDMKAAMARAVALRDSRVVVVASGARAMIETWRDGLTISAAHAGLVLVDRGQRRSPRQLAAGVVTLDGDAMSRSLLLKAVAIAAGREKADSDEASIGLRSASYAPPDREEALAKGRLVLVAEDNDVNQKVIRRQLALLGLAADIVDNGRDALMAWRDGDYPLLLTDLHMPDMDGYELASAIRSEETRDRHTPIVALTANALRGEDERCRAAGMDGYIVKPVEIDTLRKVLSRWLPDAKDEDDKAEVPSPVEKAAVFERNAIVRLIGEDDAMAMQLLANFQTSARRTAEELAGAVEKADLAQVVALSHRLKSSARAVGTHVLADVCGELEQVGKAKDAGQVAREHLRFQGALGAALAAIEEYQNEID